MLFRISAASRHVVCLVTVALACVALIATAEESKPFDGRPWNVSSGNASTFFIRASPIGAGPTKDFTEAPPDAAWLQKMRAAGMVSFEDYIAWGAVERTRGQWNWDQHDRMEKAMHAAGLKYVVYTWLHFPPTWLRDDAKGERTLMRCLAHGQETNYLSVFDPRTIEWYDYFYKALKDHFGDRVDDVYACILGPYGEGNYPLNVPDWVNIGHCHEGWWAGDEHAIRAFREAMATKYGDVAKLNAAWGTSLGSFTDVKPPAELSDEKFKPSPAAFKTSGDKRRWLDFITWYHQALIDFSERSLQTVLKYFPKEKVRIKPGGTSHGINPITYGTYSPGYAKMLGKYAGITSQPADCVGAPFADKWLGTAYQFYGVRLGTEPAGSLDRAGFVRRMFSDASAGASQLFTYEIEQHISEIQQYISLYTGKSGETAVALYCPTTFHRLGGDATPSVMAGDSLRDLCEFDVLDELLIHDDALVKQRYRALVVVQADVVDQPVLDKILAFTRAGGRVITLGKLPFRNVDGQASPVGSAATQITGMRPDDQWLRELATELKDLKGVDGQLDGLWTCRRGQQVLVFNSTNQPQRTTVAGVAVDIAPHTIWTHPAPAPAATP
jgi:hypothetical protein